MDFLSYKDTSYNCDGCFTILGIFGYVALDSRLSTCLYYDNEDMVLFVKY